MQLERDLQLGDAERSRLFFFCAHLTKSTSNVWNVEKEIAAMIDQSESQVVKMLYNWREGNKNMRDVSVIFFFFTLRGDFCAAL